MVDDIRTVFGYNERFAQYIIRQWFSKCYKLDDDWFKPKGYPLPNIPACEEEGGDGMFYGEDYESE